MMSVYGTRFSRENPDATSSANSFRKSAVMFARRSDTEVPSCLTFNSRPTTLENELAQIFLLENRVQPFADVRPVDDHVLPFQIRAAEADLFDHSLQDRVQTPCANILGRAVHFVGDIGQGFDAVAGELQCDSFGGQ